MAFGVRLISEMLWERRGLPITPKLSLISLCLGGHLEASVQITLGETAPGARESAVKGPFRPPCCSAQDGQSRPVPETTGSPCTRRWLPVPNPKALYKALVFSNVSASGLSLQRMDLQRSGLPLRHLERETPRMGGRIEWLLCVHSHSCLQIVPVSEARLQNYTVLTHNYLQLG